MFIFAPNKNRNTMDLQTDIQRERNNRDYKVAMRMNQVIREQPLASRYRVAQSVAAEFGLQPQTCVNIYKRVNQRLARRQEE